MRRLMLLAFTLAALVITGCSSGNDPINADKDRPVHPKKQKEKEKDK